MDCMMDVILLFHYIYNNNIIINFIKILGAVSQIIYKNCLFKGIIDFIVKYYST